MTTIATDGKSMAGDGCTYTNGTLASVNSIKVHRLNDGALFGACGGTGWGDQLQTWIEGGQQGEPPKGEGGDAFLILKPDGTIWQGGHDGLSAEVSAPFAIGSGMDYAIGAMDFGASPAKAVEVASFRNPHTGGIITSLELASPLQVAA